MSRSGLGREASLAVFEPLLSLGFRKRAGDIYTLMVGDGFLGWLGLPRAYRREEDAVAVDPVVGVRHQEVERVVAELRGKPPHAYMPATVSRPIGYLTPASRYVTFKFHRNRPTTAPASELVKTVEHYGIPFMRGGASLEDLQRLIEVGAAPTHQQLAYRHPVVCVLMGDCAAALRQLDQELAEIGDRQDPAADDYRVFAERFRKRVVDPDRLGSDDCGWATPR